MSFELESIRSAMKDTAYNRVIDDIRDNINEKTDLKDIASICLEKLVDATQSVGGTFWYFDRNQQIIRAYAVYGGKDLSNIILKPYQGVAGGVIYSGEPVLINNVKNNTSWSQNTDSKTGFSTDTMICIPVKIKNIIIGCVQLVNMKFGFSFEQKDLDFAKKLIGLVCAELESNAPILENILKRIDQTKDYKFPIGMESFFDLLRQYKLDLTAEKLKDVATYNSLSDTNKALVLTHLKDISKIINRKR